MTRLVDAVDVANAALMEGGLRPVAFRRPDGLIGAPLPPPGNLRATRRAMLLGRMAANPKADAACHPCWVQAGGLDHQATWCGRLPVRDVLAGFTCGRHQ